jgi:hypothetical protein
LRAGLSRGGNAGNEEVIKLCLVSATGNVISDDCLLYSLCPYPSKSKWPCLAAQSRAFVQVAPGVGFSPLLVPSQWCVPPDSVVTGLPRGRTGPSYMVLLAPSMRRKARVGRLVAGTAALGGSTARAALRNQVTRCMLEIIRRGRLTVSLPQC